MIGIENLFVSEIRKDWADKVNQYLKDRNIDQQITEKSHAELGKKNYQQFTKDFTQKLEDKGYKRVKKEKFRNSKLQ